MRNIYRRLAQFIGWRTSYHVAAQYTRDSYIGPSVISLTVTMSPWLHRDNYRALIEYMHSECEKPAAMPTITSITKLGA